MILENTTDFELITCREVKRFHVGVRCSSNSFSFKVTDAGMRKIRADVEKAGDGASYEFDYGDYRNAVILVPESIIPLEQFSP